MGPSISTVKTLFALSCNVCAYRGCEERLTDPSWEQVNAEIAHIRGDRPGSARHDPSMTEEERQAFANLMLLCPNHHKRIDRLEPDEHSVEVLETMKAQHERSCAGNWAGEAQLSLFAQMAVGARDAGSDSSGLEGPRPHLVLEKAGRDSFELRNIGDADAFNIEVVPLDGETDGVWVPSGSAPRRLSPQASWQAGLYAPSLASGGPHILSVFFSDGTGKNFDAEFPLT